MSGVKIRLRASSAFFLQVIHFVKKKGFSNIYLIHHTCLLVFSKTCRSYKQFWIILKTNTDPL